MKSLTNYIIESQQVKLDPDGKEHGFEYVDLGLPSGTMWAACNIGADKPEDDGLLFQFGRVDGYKYGDKNNKFFTTEGNNYINTSTSGTTYGKSDILKLEDDAAHVNMGGKWIMPTKADLQELYDNTTKSVMTIHGKKGVVLTSKRNGKSIFVVFSGWWRWADSEFCDSEYAGYIRSSEVNSRDSKYAWLFRSYSSGYSGIYYGDARNNAYSVRGVFKK